MSFTQAFWDAITRLKGYNLGIYNAVSNALGLSGVGGMAANWAKHSKDLATVGEQIATAFGTIAASVSTTGLTWDASTAATDPGAGKARATVAPPTAGSFSLVISTIDAVGQDVSALIADMGASTSSAKARARLVKVGNPSVYVDVSITGVSGAGSYRTVAVTYLAGPGGFAAGDAVALGWVRTGDKGDTGANGNGPLWGGTSGGSANVQTLTPSTPLGSLAGNSSYEFVAGYSITGAATLNVSGTGAVSIRKADGTAAGAGDIVAGTKYVVTLVSGQWWLSAGGAVAGPVWYGTSGGTANAQTLSGALSVLTGNPSVEFIAGATNGSVTRTNLLPYSKQFDNAAYGKSMVTVTADAAAWIDGNTVMDKIVETATTGYHAISYVSVSGLTASTTYTLSVYLKAAERSKGRLSFLDSSFTDGVIAAFDLSAGTVAASASGAGSNAAATIDALPGGIYRVSVTGRMNNSRTAGGLYLNLRDGTGADSYAGVAGSGLYAVGAQLETGTVATPLITTSASSVSVSDGHMSLGVGSTAAKPLLDYAGNALTIGAVAYGCKYVATYDGAYWRLAGGSGSAGGFVARTLSKSANYTTSTADNKCLVKYTAAATHTLLAAVSAGAGFTQVIKAVGGAVSIAAASGETVNNTSAYTLEQGASALIVSDGVSAYDLVLMPAVTTASASTCAWNPADVDSTLVLSNGNLTIASGAGGIRSGRANKSISSGNFYWEFGTSVSDGCVIGMGTSAFSLLNYLGADASGWGYGADGKKWNNGTGAAYGSTWSTGTHRIGIFARSTATNVFNLWIAVDGVVQGGGDPIAGTSPMFTGISGPLFPAFGDNSSTGAPAGTAYFSASSWLYVPSTAFAQIP